MSAPCAAALLIVVLTAPKKNEAPISHCHQNMRMYTLTAARAQENAFANGITHARANVPIRPKPSTLKRLFAWPWSDSLCSPESDWRRVANLAVGASAAGPQVLTLHS